MPKIKFELKDPKYCNGCKILGSKGAYCSLFDILMCYKVSKTDDPINDYSNRPSACIAKYGEWIMKKIIEYIAFVVLVLNFFMGTIYMSLILCDMVNNCFLKFSTFITYIILSILILVFIKRHT